MLAKEPGPYTAAAKGLGTSKSDQEGMQGRMTVINLPFPPSLNNMFINGTRGRFRSQKYDSWIQAAGCEIMRQRPSKVAGPVILSFEFGEPDNRKRDISNLIKAPEDLLVKHGIIEADDGSIVRCINALWSPEIEGVRITIESIFSNRGTAA